MNKTLFMSGQRSAIKEVNDCATNCNNNHLTRDVFVAGSIDPDLILDLFSDSQAERLRTFLRLIVPVLFFSLVITSILIGTLSGSKAIRLNFLLRLVFGRMGEKFSFTESVSILRIFLLALLLPLAVLTTDPGSRKFFLRLELALLDC